MLCPFLKKECVQSKCMLWITGIKKDLKSGDLTPYSNCALGEIPVMLIDVIRNTSGIQAAVESHRNEGTQRQDDLLNVLLQNRQLNGG